MTTPTQAQIEAAAKALAELTDCDIPNCTQCKEYAEAALTAAAEVENRQPDDTFDQGYKYKEAECEDEIAATIERCAQVAEAVGEDGQGGRIAAAIRALKDK